MKTLLFFFVLLVLSLAKGENNDVVVLVHGLGGSAETWDYTPELEQAGLVTVAVEVNPFASNHDRACELFAQLKGLKTDYGLCHSEEAGHLRFGPDFTGNAMLPNWGVDEKIHLVGHSMGGLTIRHLERLLEEGSGCAEDESELFQGGHNWITSVTTMASPLDGTTIFDNVFGFENILINQFVATGIVDEENLAFPQWGLVREEGESFDDFFDRVKDSGLFEEEDFSIEDMRVSGASKFNNDGVQTYPERFYFSFAPERTNPKDVCNLFFICYTIQVPDEAMDEDLATSASLIGRLADDEDEVNDGIVNQNRAKCPTGNGCKEVTDGSTDWEIEEWHFISIDFLDHFQIVTRDEINDGNNFAGSARRLFLEHALRLKELPSTSVASFSVESHEDYSRIKRYIDSKHQMDDLFVEVDGLSNGTMFVGTFFIFILLSFMFLSSTYYGKKLFTNEKVHTEISRHNTAVSV